MRPLGKIDRPEFWAAAAVVVKLGAAVLVMPVAVRTLTPERIGLWYMMINVGSAAWVIELGFAGGIARSVATYWAGGRRLAAFGFESETRDYQPNIAAIAELIAAVRLIYAVFAMLFFLVCIAATLWWIPWPSGGLFGQKDVGIAWSLFVAASVFSSYTRWQPAVLQGIGQIRRTQKIEFVGGVVNVAVGGALLLSGLDLIGLACGLVLQAVITRILVMRRMPTGSQPVWVPPARVVELVTVLWPMTWRAGLGGVANYCVTSGPIMISGHFLGLVATSSYALTMQVIQVIQSIAIIPLSTKLPDVTVARARGAQGHLSNIVYSRVAIGLVLYILGAVVLFATGPLLLGMLRSNVSLVGGWCLVVVLVTRFMDLNHTQFAKLSVALNRNDFALVGAGFACATLLCSYLAVQYFGLMGLILGVLVGQLAYNNWAPIACVCRDMNVSIRKLYGELAWGLFRMLLRCFNSI